MSRQPSNSFFFLDISVWNDGLNDRQAYTLLQTTLYLPSNAFHHHPGHRGNCPSLRVVEGALGVIQTSQGSNLLLRNGGLVWWLKESKKEISEQIIIIITIMCTIYKKVKVAIILQFPWALLSIWTAFPVELVETTTALQCILQMAPQKSNSAGLRNIYRDDTSRALQ